MRERIEAYARLLVETGVNIQKGQSLVIAASVDNAKFVRLCADAAYDAGCREVNVMWRDSRLSRMKYIRAEDSVFDEYPSWLAAMYNDTSARGDAFLSIDSSDPEAMSGVNPDRIRRSSMAAGKATADFRQRQMTDGIQWSIGAVPSPEWAKKVFPDQSESDATADLWNAILDSVRVYAGGDPVLEWQKHIATLKARVEKLNGWNFKYLKYKNKLGTDLTVELPENHYWDGGSSKSRSGVDFCANMPTEEIFTAPKRDGVNGIVYSSRPLVVNGNIVDKFSFEFKDGKAVKVSAQAGQEFLESAMSVDEGALYLGEAALVPYNSPISRSGILFYNTLFDENASCHLALGEAYPCVKGGSGMSPDRLKEAGLNSSIAHMDFMIGTPDLSITGITHDGREIQVFQDGNFTF